MIRMICLIKNIVFDIGGVLVDFRYKAYAIDLGLSREEAEAVSAAMINTPEWELLDRGIISQTEAREHFIRENPKLNKQIELFWNDLTEIVRSYPDSRDWVGSLKERGYGIYLLTNYPDEMFALHSKTQFSFFEYVDGTVVSASVKLTKPDMRIYRMLLDKYGLKAEECVFLDDREENTLAARETGFLTVTVSDRKKAKEELESILKERGEYR